MRCEYLPPYSPDLNPIELAFSAMKYHLRRNGDYVRMAMMVLSDEDIYVTLLGALYTITPEDAYGWFAHCGYIYITFILAVPILHPHLDAMTCCSFRTKCGHSLCHHSQALRPCKDSSIHPHPSLCSSLPQVRLRRSSCYMPIPSFVLLPLLSPSPSPCPYPCLSPSH